VQEILAQAARSGIDATKDILNQRILGEQHGTEDVLGTLLSTDKGLRRATTAAQNLQAQLRPEQLPPEALNGTPQQWAEQTRAVSQMVGQLGNTGFNDKVDGRFLDYGTSGEANPFNSVAKDHPQLDHQVRNWLADGVGLLDELLSAQERAFDGQPPLSNDEMTALKERVNSFATPPGGLEMEDFTSGVMQEYDEKKAQVNKPEGS
jgi:hypothetical protein